MVGLKVAGATLGGLGLLVMIRFLFGAGEAGAYPNITRALHNWFPVQEWATAQGFVWMAGRLMGGLTPLVWMLLVTGTAWTPGLVSWRGAFCVLIQRAFGCEHRTPRGHELVDQLHTQVRGDRRVSLAPAFASYDKMMRVAAFSCIP